MHLTELVEALAINENLPDQFHYDSELCTFDPYTNLDLSPSLLTVFHGSSDTNRATGDLTIGLAHFSVKEFLM